MSVNGDVLRGVNRPLYVLPFWADALAGLVFVYATVLMVEVHGAYWGWQISHAHMGFSHLGYADALAACQVGSLALMLDQTFRRMFRLLNRAVGVNIPTLVGQLVSYFIYAVLALVFYKLFFKVDLDGLLAMSGVLLLGISYLLKDTIDDVLCSVQIQADRSIAVGDWLAIEDLSEDQLYLFRQLDRRMVMLEDHAGSTRLIRASDYFKFNVVNMSRQPGGHKRKIAVNLEVWIPEAQAIQVVGNAAQSLASEKPGWVARHTVGLEDVAVYKYDLFVEYFCTPDVSVVQSNSALRQRVFKYLRCAGFVDHLTNLGQLSAGVLDERFNDDPGRRALPGVNILNILLGLKDYGVLSPLSHDDLMLLARDAQLCRFQPGELVLAKGGLDDHLLLISQGQLKVTLASAEETPSAVTLFPGDCVGEMGFFTGQPRSADVHAQTDVVLVRLPRAGFQALMDRNASIAPMLAAVIKDRSMEVLHAEDSAGKEDLCVHSLASRILAFFGVKRGASPGLDASH